MVLIPDLATDLGTPNDDFTTWTFTLRAGIKYENGKPVTAEDIAFGIERSFDRTTFPDGADLQQRVLPGRRHLQGPLQVDGETTTASRSAADTITIKMAQPFPDMPYWACVPGHRPDPARQGAATRRSTSCTRGRPVRTCSSRQLHAWKSLTLVKNPNWDPNTDPGRHQYVDEFDFNFDARPRKIDQIMLADNGDAEQHARRTTTSRARLPCQFRTSAQDRLVIGSARAPRTGPLTTARSPTSTSARRSPGPTRMPTSTRRPV